MVPCKNAIRKFLSQSVPRALWRTRVVCLHARTSDHPMGVESDSDIFHLGNALSRTEAGFSMDRDAAVKFYGDWYKRWAKGVFCSTIGSMEVSISTWTSASGCQYTRALRYRVPGYWQVLDCVSPEPTGARLRREIARRE
jgi:hypothetical protein